MNSNSDSPTFLLDSPILHPKLRAALETLDIELEAELANFRRFRQGSLPSNPQAPVVELPVVKDSPQPDHSSSESSPPESFATESPTTAFYNFETQELGQLHPPLGVADLSNIPVAGLSASLSLNPLETPTPNPANLEGLSHELEAELDQIAQDENFQNLTRSLLQPTSSPNDYLASSEALLKNVGTAKVVKKRPRQAPKPKISVWGVAAIAGLGLSLLAAVAILNPGLWNRSRPAPTANQPATETPVAGNPASPEGPNLAEKEFVDLNMQNLSRMQPTATPQAGKVIPSPQNAPNTPLTGSSPVAPKVAAPISAPKISSPKVSSPKTSPPQGVSKLSPVPVGVTAGSDNYYYVVMPVSGAASFNQAQKVVPGAYVVKFAEGTKIQFGAFLDMQSAQDLVQKLKNRGITATVREPRPRTKVGGGA
jgi:hypothetical protein